MTKKEKALIDTAIEYDGSPLDGLYIISAHKLYKGFWGENGYNEMIILGYRWPKDEKCRYEEKIVYHFNLNYQKDVLQCFKDIQFSMDMPNEYDCLRLCFREPIVVRKEQLSAFMIDSL